LCNQQDVAVKRYRSSIDAAMRAAKPHSAACAFSASMKPPDWRCHNAA
jgi:hypothetical protein